MCIFLDDDDWDDSDNIPSEDEAENGVAENSMDLEGTKDLLPPEVRLKVVIQNGCDETNRK